MSRDTSVLPPALKAKKELVVLKPTEAVGTNGHYAADTFDAAGYDNSFDMSHFKETFDIKIVRKDEESIEFDMINIDAPIANAFRRILLSEVPTLALEKVYIQDNTSIIPDELLAHRLGLIPIKADPAAFDFVNEDGEATFSNTVVFRLEIECSRRPDVGDDAPDEEKYENESVMSGDLAWIAQGEQEEQFAEGIKPVHDDILIARLRPGQRIELEAHAQKGIGQTHAKWSPVATASYRLLPRLTVKEDLELDEVDRLQSMSMNVFDVQSTGDGKQRAKLSRPRDCTMCRECIRQPDWGQRVQLAKVKSHFIFSVESTGILPPEELVREAIRILMRKCVTAQAALDNLAADDDDGNDDGMEGEDDNTDEDEAGTVEQQEGAE